MKPFALTGARVFDGVEFLEEHAVVVDGARIAAVIPATDLSPGKEVHHLDGGLLVPGFIDVQVNGGGGALFNADPSVPCVGRIASAHRAFGTTGMLPTIITDAPSKVSSAIAAVRSSRRQGMAGILGIHIEGPFIDPDRKGAHDLHYIRLPAQADIDELAEADCGRLILTMAPNRVAPDMIRAMTDRGVIVSLGHAEATAAEVQAALRAGARAFTHIFNAMSQLNGREPGMVGVALSDPGSFCSLIADGLHVHDTAMTVALAAKPRGRMMLITDAMPPAAGGPDTFELQGRLVTRTDGRLQLAGGTLAGSSLTMDEAVRYCVNRLGVDLAETLRMASLYPATFLRHEHELGRIAPGYIASLVHLSNDLQVRNTWIDGK